VKRTFDLPPTETLFFRGSCRLTSAMFRQLVRNVKDRFRITSCRNAGAGAALHGRSRRQPDPHLTVLAICLGLSPASSRAKHAARALEENGYLLTVAHIDAKCYFEVTGCHSGSDTGFARDLDEHLRARRRRASACWFVLCPQRVLVSGTSCLDRKLRWRPTSVAR